MKIVKWLLIIIVLILVIPIFGFWIHGTFFYDYELKQIKSELNKVEGISIIDIWGYNDFTLENISARIKVKGKGEIELINLSSDDDDYSKKVLISEIGGYKFRIFSCSDFQGMGYHQGLGFAIDISEYSEIGKRIGVKIRNPKMIIDNYDDVLNTIESLKKTPELNYFKNENGEKYILVYQNENQIESLFQEYGVDNFADFQMKMTFDEDDCN